MTRTSLRRPACGAAWLGLLLLASPDARAACGLSQGDFDKNGFGDVRILGSIRPQKVIVDAGQSATVISLDCDGDGAFTHPGAGDIDHKSFPAFYSYEILLKGSDVIFFNVADDWSGVTRNLQISLGGGANKITIGGAGALRAGSRLVANVMGVAGADTVAVVVPEVEASSLLVKEDLNDGNNTAIVVSSRPITSGSVVAINAALGGVKNDFKFTHSGLADGTLDVNIDGGAASTDTGNLTLSGQVGPNGRVFFRSSLGAGDDSLLGAIDLASFSIAAGGELHLDVAGGAGADLLKLTRGTSIGGAGTVLDGLFDIAFKGGDGDDSLGLDLGGGGFSMNGTLRARLDGNAGNDVVTGTVDVDAASLTPQLDVALLGEGGSDTLSLTVNDDGPRTPASYGPAGTAFVDGGFGNDTCSAAGTGLIHKRNCEH